jgi:glutamate synthase domain-containing protein 2/glutamate synthase domain-containing protein 1/glutamate synthase domain-containing protein 3
MGFIHQLPEPRGLYHPRYESDSCGVGFVADISGHRSYQILEKAMQALMNLTHRGAIDADAGSGDGAGMLTQIPHKLFRRELEKMGYRLAHDTDLGVGMVFLPPKRPDMSVEEKLAWDRCVTIVEEVLNNHDLTLFGWRQVPVDPSALGEKAAREMPDIQQILVGKPKDMKDGDEYERVLYLARKQIEKRIAKRGIKNFYIPSFSHRTIVYKGLFVAPQLKRFYKDLRDKSYETAFAIYHQRYSTNTFPTWFLAQPFRLLAHNGEINTLQGNENWMKAREREMTSPLWKKIEDLTPVIQEGGSDSAKLDNVFELLTKSGRHPLHAMMMLVPEAYQNMPHMDEDLRAFFEYHATLVEPWDGPAALVFSDGNVVAATLDRNGLRPARYTITDDNIIVMGSEVGVVDVDAKKVVEKGRLGPGKMIAVDLVKGTFLRNDDIKRMFVHRQPYREWLKNHLIRPQALGLGTNGHVPARRTPELVQQQKAFGYTIEDVEKVVEPMALEAKESVGSMGDDTPLSVLSTKPRVLYTYFKQRFAQVTNPPIDPLREDLVMSLRTAIGARNSLLEETEQHARLIKFNSPILTNSELDWLRMFENEHFKSVTLPVLFDVVDGEAGLETTLITLCAEAERAIAEGKTILILSDRGMTADQASVPMLLAVGAVHHHLIRAGKRMKASIVCETGEPREEHHFACLIGYGASLINPYLAFECMTPLAARVRQKAKRDKDYDKFADITPEKAAANWQKAVEKGILKIMSKMGISTVSSYRGAQIFEAIGLDKSLIDRCFTGTDSRIGGVGLKEIARDVLRFHELAFKDNDERLLDFGYYKFRKDGEAHAFNPQVMRALHDAVRNGDFERAYRTYARLVNEREPIALRDLLRFQSDREPIAVDEVEPVENIVRRFCTPGMSHGALSRETHITLAIAMNRLGAKTNSGEGGEDPVRYHRFEKDGVIPGTEIPVKKGDWANSLIKQVASARFGVTPEYLASATQLEIKMAQGSKPGEGGQLPGHKVSEEIAAIRHSVPGVTLISPPPHHDIYSIEDLSQLIYDLKRANPRAKVAVKLVAEAGVGTVAAGVAKGYADVVHISGHDGGTGASPWGSIKNAGLPWELGLAETQQVLMMNGMRGRITVRVDGGLKTGRDVVVAAMLGGEEYGFGSAAVVAAGCVMARQCHLNTCPVGVATQRPDLRSRFPGKPDDVVNYFTFIAQEVREILASLGYRSLDEIIGGTHLLTVRDDLNLPKTTNIDLSQILKNVDENGQLPHRHTKDRNDRLGDEALDDRIVEDARDAVQKRGSIRLRHNIRNIHRAVGATLSYMIAYQHGDAGLPDGSIEISFKGSAGQSFGAFCINGMRLILEGEANDYVGKGMHGGEIIVFPPKKSTFATHENVIIGNTVMYGATGGALYAAGTAGERFCVRNSGGVAVVEGVGDHGCEYMTGGVVVVLGATGRNFGAGMTGGVAFVLDEDDSFKTKLNPQLVSAERLGDHRDVLDLREMIERHYGFTKSPRAEDILDNLDYYLPMFWKVVPHPSEGLPKSPTKLATKKVKKRVVRRPLAERVEQNQ